MVAKRKTMSALSNSKVGATKADAPEVDDMEGQIVPAEVTSKSGKVMKRPAGRAAAVPVEEEPEENEDNEEDMEVEEEEEEEEEVSEEEKQKRREKEIVEERTKELKLTYMQDLKELVSKAGLASGNKKEDMIKAVLKHEAKLRAKRREHEAKIRAVVVEKKEELESMSATQLNKLCHDSGIEGVRAKSERIQRLLVQWQQEDGVDKALAQKALEERKEELVSMDSMDLRKMCDKAKLDPFVKEVLVDRISKMEFRMGRYAKPTLKQDNAPQEGKKLDMVAALMASESTRKKEKELQSKKEEEAAKKIKELRALSLEELKKAVAKKGLQEATGKKEEMVEALFRASAEEEKRAARKAELKKMGNAALKELITSNGLEPGSANSMVEAMLAHEDKCHQELQLFEAKIDEILVKKKEELEKKSLGALKDLCAAKGLALGGAREDKMERLLEDARNDGQVDKVVGTIMRNARKEALMSMEKADLVKLCEKLGADPYVPHVMAERILDYEEECDQPVTKKARTAN